MLTVKPPHKIPSSTDHFKVFLAGSIEMGVAENWQQKMEHALSGEEKVVLLNPRRDDWNASWKQEVTNQQFHEQVTWEMDGLESADLIVFYFSPGTQSPVTMLELGLFARSGKLVVCCPEGFWRKGNVDMVCQRFNIEQVDTLEALIQKIKNR
ncbi:MAG: nucleoside 2-deoxyribosyltransferase domain-containing protein [Fluviicola sp.]